MSTFTSSHILTSEPLPLEIHEDDKDAIRLVIDTEDTRQVLTLHGPNARANLIAYRDRLDAFLAQTAPAPLSVMA